MIEHINSNTNISRLENERMMQYFLSLRGKFEESEYSRIERAYDIEYLIVKSCCFYTLLNNYKWCVCSSREKNYVYIK